MFLPEYKAIEFIKRMEGGRSFPWQIRARREDNSAASFVVKLYKEADVENGVLFKECLSSYLIKEFDMKTPSVALIQFDSNFLDTLDEKNRLFLNSRDRRIMFATLLIEDPYANYSPLIHEKLIDGFNMFMLYAFDNLILNCDRRRIKPNLLVKSHELILIDHEITFGQNPIACIYTKATWSHHYQEHIFYEAVKKMSPKIRKDGFDTFHEYLRCMNIHDFEEQVEQLMEHEHNVTSYCSYIKPYLCAAKDHPDRFIDILNRTLS